MYQLTDFRHPDGSWGPPTSNQLWSWKANCLAGCNYLVYKQGEADNYMPAQRDTAIIYGGGLHYFVPTHTVHNVVFEDNTARCIEHAVAMKLYNGLGLDAQRLQEYGFDSTIYPVGNRYYCQWNKDNLAWQFNTAAYYVRIDEITHDTTLTANYYVSDVCSHVP